MGKFKLDQFDISGLGDGIAQGIKDALIEAVDPRMNGERLSPFPCVFDDGGACDMACLREDVEFAEAIKALVVLEGVEFGFVHAGEGADWSEPVIDDSVAKIFESCLNAAAAVVTADDDVGDFQDIDGVLKYGKDVEVGFLDDVSDIAVDEYFAGRKAGDLVSGDA